MINQPVQPETAVIVRPFQPGDQAAFQELNEAWIRRYFALEAKDREILGDPEGTILSQGGAILFATVAEIPVGCCALIRQPPDEYELSKMAVDEEYQGRGIGRKLIEAAIDEARGKGARRIWLETNHSLVPALRLYKGAGFAPAHHGEEHRSDYSRADVYLELWL